MPSNSNVKQLVNESRVELTAYRAAVSGDRPTLRDLLDRSPELLNIETPFGSLLHVTASHGHLELVQELVHRGLDVNRRGGTFRGAPINVAASNGRREVVQYLLKCGASLDVSEPERNPLFAAIYGGHLEIARMLIEAGLDPRVRYSGESMKNMSALDYAVERGQSEIAAYLQALEEPQ